MIQEKMEKDELRHIHSIDEVFNSRNMTFADIEKLNYKQFKGKNADSFKPSDILDLNDNDDDEDEILMKFRDSSPKRKKSPNVRKNLSNESTPYMNRK